MFETPQFSPEVLKQIKKNEIKYQKAAQIAFYSTLDHIEKERIFTKSLCDVQSNVVFCFDSEKVTNNKDSIYYVIRILDEEIPKLKNKYSIAYIHDSYAKYKSFMGMLEILPEIYLLKLRTIYMVNAGTSGKLYSKMFFGPINSLLLAKMQYTDSIQEIQEKNKISLSGQTMKKSKIKIKQNQPVNLPQINTEYPSIIRNQIYGRQIWEYELNQYKIPKLLFSLVGKLYSNPEFLIKQGIMRKSCDVEQLEILEQHLIQEQNPYEFIWAFEDSNVIGGCVKKILNNLNTPLFKYELYEAIQIYKSDGNTQSDVQFLKNCIDQLDIVNRNVFVFILVFFLEGIVKYKEQNKMSIYNLAVVFGPCFFRPKKYSLQDLFSSGKFSFFIKLALDNFNSIIPQEQSSKILEILENSKI